MRVTKSDFVTSNYMNGFNAIQSTNGVSEDFLCTNIVISNGVKCVLSFKLQEVGVSVY